MARPVQYVPPHVDGRGLGAPCVLFPGRSRGGGSGEYGLIKTPHGQTTAHRWSFEVAYGPIPDGHDVDHRCRIKLCWLPDHLEAVTPTENLRRAGRIKLTEHDVVAIRARRTAGATLKTIGMEFGISNVQAGNIVNRRQWKKVP
jgi:hypothetical protein